MLTFLLVSLIVLASILVLSVIVCLFAIRDEGSAGSIAFPIAVIAMVLISLLLITIGIMLITDPQSVYVSIHWLWILGVGVFAPIILALIPLLFDIKSFKLIQAFFGIAIFVLMVCGIKLAPNTIYEIGAPEDINLFNNLPSPSGKTYYFEVVDDIDFDGFEFKESYGIPSSYVIIEGNGYTWSNIVYEITTDSYDITFFDLCTYASSTNYSGIQNLTITNSYFYITPNNYDEFKHEGRPVDFEIISSYIKFENFTLEATVYCGEAEENIRSDSPSYMGKILPENVYDEEKNVTIDITVMEP